MRWLFLAIATNLPQRLKTGFVVQGHICVCTQARLCDHVSLYHTHTHTHIHTTLHCDPLSLSLTCTNDTQNSWLLKLITNILAVADSEVQIVIAKSELPPLLGSRNGHPWNALLFTASPWHGCFNTTAVTETTLYANISTSWLRHVGACLNEPF